MFNSENILYLITSLSPSSTNTDCVIFRRAGDKEIRGDAMAGERELRGPA